MIIVDTSVWIDHLDKGDPAMEELLLRERVLMHPYVLGEIALGKLKKRKQLLDNLAKLAAATVAADTDVVAAIESLDLDGTGIGYVDAHLLVSAKIEGAKLWTRDKRLLIQARRLDVEHGALH